MGRGYYRRRRGSLVGDAASAMLRISWQGALLIGIAGSIIFSLLLPWFLQSILASQQSQAGPTTVLEQVIEHRQHWAERLGEVFLWLGILVAGLKLLAGNLESCRHQPGLPGFLARLLARWSD
ncbi:hypothetical protein [Aeromonas sp. sif2416]|uniref:hypothetical protein n=1 Tax=Aeromonas sp. sif2416 TaxID=2854793 RepID=UPI001C470A8A|nr:hypothetical protein [Aeromonas sp. sif2416]MBV7435906.1 hypothetical protein [Aeromonas sp. sif2416]